ncbi:MAG: biopolymer transporter ExbD [Phycisphaerae bacterium]|jgi:biopolymer transport protein ExbD|nr:biopolymer transporter ExbD [Phycisphaerae bacterium]
MKLRRSRRTRLDPTQLRLPLIALIDVVLFLLFYFIIAGNIDNEENELAATLALVGTAPSEESQAKAHMLAVTADVIGPAYRIAGAEVRARDELLGILRGLPKEVGVVIRSSPTIPFEMVAGAMQIAHDAGFERITYLPDS